MSNQKQAIPVARSTLRAVSERVSFPQEEVIIEKYWDDIKAFETSVKQSEDEKRPIYTFYDGPPFATGLPHYGHILAGTIKDIVTRYAHQTGHHVTRRFGWDCHGLPVEYEIDQKLGIKTKEDVMKMGVPAYNAECRSIVQRYSSEWESRIKRMGRWIDFRNDYKTMDLKFMESVWWVFSQLHSKGLVYRGFKVMPYSTACTTPLSNFEANLNYKEVADPAVVVSFPIRDQENTSFLAWTTTPWTLPSNMALCVHPEFDYVKVKDNASGHFYILAQSRLSELYAAKKGHGAATAPAEEKTADGNANPKPAGGKKDKKDKAAKPEAAAAAAADGVAAPVVTPLDTSAFTIIQSYKGKELEGWKYTPLFSYFATEEQKVGAFRVITGDWVTADSGTGIVHCAPAFGEDDYTTCVKHGIVKLGAAIICPVDASGRFTDEVKDFAGRHVKEADGDIMRLLKKQNRVVKQSQLTHSYPFCWRSETPLIYKAVPSWFVSVEKIKQQLLANNEITYWVPAFVKEKRFYNWIKDARDWAISRNRYWGTPLPIWMSDDEKEIVIIGSVEELERLSGVKGITDLHKDKIDHITIPSKEGRGVLKRVEEVFDCWFESGSMPYAQQHYPFENKSIFENGFPADFIAEGLDQTRGWFYTLMVISTGLFNKPAFKNLIVNGLVLAADGKKMSKRLKNYPDPMEVVERHGADALRIYLINSPVVRAEPLRFKEEGVHEVVKKVFLPWFHAYRFWVENVHRFESATKQPFRCEPDATHHLTNVMDRWIMAALTSLIEFVKVEMGAYRLYTVIPRLLTFIDQMTNWYVRMNRKRLKGSGGEADAKAALQTLFQVLYALTRLMAPFTPFLVESMYQNLKQVLPIADQRDSVHYLNIPTADVSVKDDVIERAVNRMQAIVELGRAARDNRKVTMKMPIKHVWVVHKDQQYLNDVKGLSSYLTAELNVRDITFSNEIGKFVKLVAQPNQRAIGQRFKGDAKAIIAEVQTLSDEALQGLQSTGKIVVKGHELTTEEVEVVWSFQGDKKTLEDASNRDVLVIIDTTQDAELLSLYLSREMINRVQRLRKSIGLTPSEDVEIWYDVTDKKETTNIIQALKTQANSITETLGRPLSPISLKPSYAVVLGEETSEVDGHPFRVIITRSTVLFNAEAMKKLASEQKWDETFTNTLQSYVASREWAPLRTQVTSSQGKLQVTLDERDITLQHGTHFYFTTAELQKPNSL